MKLESHTSSTITTETYQILTETHGPVTYIEYLNDKGKVIDGNLRDENGNEINDPNLLEAVSIFVEEHEEQQRRDEKNGLYGDKEDVAN